MKTKLVLFLSLCLFQKLNAQEIMLQGWYWNYPNSVNGNRYIKYLGNLAAEFKAAGFTYIWTPPLSGGTGSIQTNGYDIRDYYDLGQYRSTGWGTRGQLLAAVATFNANGIDLVADMVYNHRDGGFPEDNPAVKGWVTTMNATKIAAGDQPFPSDRYRCYLPLGGASPNGAGTYYFKLSSASADARFFNKTYTLTMWTNKVPVNNSLPILTETVDNGGGDCGQASDQMYVGRKIACTIDNSACKTDEFKVVIDPAHFNATGDTLWIGMANGGNLGNQTDHRFYGVWSTARNQDIVGDIGFQTYTDFTKLPSGRGGMTWRNFNPNGNPTSLGGDLDAMYFYYDLDHRVQSTRDTLFAWTKWMWDTYGMRGIRVDAIKHIRPDFLGDLLDYMHDQNKDLKMVVGESFDFNASTLKYQLDQILNNMDADTKQAIRPRVFDFSLRMALKNACDAFGYDVRNVFNASMVDAAGASGYNVVTFVNNHDFRVGEPNGPLTNNPELGYAYILTNNKVGVPCVYMSDYQKSDTLKYQIMALAKAHKRYIYGANSVEYLSRFSSPYTASFSSGFPNTSLIYQIENSTENKVVVVAINFAGDPMRVYQKIKPSAYLQTGDTLTDIFRTSAEAYTRVNNNQEMYIDLPARSFGVWVKGDKRHELIPIDSTLLPTIGINPVADELPLQSMMAYPNPTQSDITVELVAMQRAENTQISVLDLMGRTLYSKTILLTEGYNNFSLPFAQLPTGMYFVRLLTDTGKQRVVKVYKQMN